MRARDDLWLAFLLEEDKCDALKCLKLASLPTLLSRFLKYIYIIFEWKNEKCDFLFCKLKHCEIINKNIIHNKLFNYLINLISLKTDIKGEIES